MRGISSDRLVIEQTGATGTELIVNRLCNGEQTVEHIGLVVPSQEEPPRPKSKRSSSSWENSD